MADWTPVTDAAGKVLGWTAAPDPDEPDVDYFEADRPRRTACRAAVVEERADVILPASALVGDQAFTADEVEEMWDASGLSDDQKDAASNVAVELWTVEQLRQLATLVT